MESLQGHFLVASPHLPDDNFYRTVVLMIQHDKDGAFGVVLNRPTDSTIREVWELYAHESCSCADPVHLGGPVGGPVLAVHGLAECQESEVLPGVYVATKKNFLNQIVRQREAPFRIFTGYSGWASGQLEGEMEAGGWLTLPAAAEDVFADYDDLWQKVSRSIGLDILSSAIRGHFVPDDPSVN